MNNNNLYKLNLSLVYENIVPPKMHICWPSISIPNPFQVESLSPLSLSLSPGAACNKSRRVNMEAWCKVSLVAIESSPRNSAPGSTNCSIPAFRFPSPRRLLVWLDLKHPQIDLKVNVLQCDALSSP